MTYNSKEMFEAALADRERDAARVWGQLMGGGWAETESAREALRRSEYQRFRHGRSENLL